MSYVKPVFKNDEYYHVVVRAVGDTVVFENESDFFRGIFCIYEFNTLKPVQIRDKLKSRKKHLRPTSVNLDDRDKIVDVLAFSFMPNHLHLILKQLKDNGITEFMKKVNGGYAKYFNTKYQRMGHLIQQISSSSYCR